MTTNFEHYKFRCSSLGKLMVNPRSKKEKLSETTKTYLRQIYIEEVFGRKKDTSSKYTEKGLYVEEDSLDLICKRYEKLLKKNKEKFENEFITGTPDLVCPDKVIDIKSSWDIFTFAESDGSNPDYFWQLQGYMWLTGKGKAELDYCLSNAPEHLIAAEKSRRMYQKMLEPGTKEFDDMERQVELWMTFDDIPDESRVKIFEFNKAPEAEFNKLIERIIAAREYLATLTL